MQPPNPDSQPSLNRSPPPGFNPHRSFWYVAALSQSVKEGKPTGVEMLGRTFVLFRGADGAVRCLDDVCPHRGAPLSGGWQAQVEGHECVVCPYHGWSFDGTGHLRDVPAAEGSQHFPQRRIQPSFPVEERGGFIWLFYGSDAVPAEERPPIPYVPELGALALALLGACLLLTACCWALLLLVPSQQPTEHTPTPACRRPRVEGGV